MAVLKSVRAAVKRVVKDLTGDDPMPRLCFAMSVAMVVGTLGIMGFLFGLFGVFLKLVSMMIEETLNDTPTWAKVGDVLDKSIWRIILGYGAAAVIHAVAKLYHKKQNPPDNDST
jgi:hypothetical protein